MTVYAAGAHVHVQMLSSVVKMATVLEKFTNEEQRFVLRFFSLFFFCVWTTKGLSANDIHIEMFLVA
jgi:hypothetical protein